MIAYIRDFAAISTDGRKLETSCPWANVLELCDKVKKTIHRDCKEQASNFDRFVSCRVTQTLTLGPLCILLRFCVSGLKAPFAHL